MATTTTFLPPVCRLATCNLNQHALDFTGNYNRIVESCLEAKRVGAKYRLGQELEITGYGCEDHFYESDTYRHAWQVLAKLLAHSDVTTNLLCDFGMPLLHRGVRYNCRVFCLNGSIVLIRPKLYLANDGNYREHRYFTPWHLDRNNEEHTLPPSIQQVSGQTKCPIGFFALESKDGITLASETCEELWTPNSPHIHLGLDGVDIVTNGSGSHHELRKLHTRMRLLLAATEKSGGVYLYSNQQGCDGGRLYFDGCSMIIVNGDVVVQASQFNVRDVEVVWADVDIEAVRSKRGSISSRSRQASTSTPIARIPINLTFADAQSSSRSPTPPLSFLKENGLPGGPSYHTPEEEISFGPSCWLWDYLRRSGASGFFLPLSGGADSASTCALVGIMCCQVYEASILGDNHDIQTLQDLRRIMGHTKERLETLKLELARVESTTSSSTASSSAASSPASSSSSAASHAAAKLRAAIDDLNVDWYPTSPMEIARRVMHTAYLGTKNSGDETRDRAKRISEEIGTFHMDCNIDAIVDGLLSAYATSMESIESAIIGGMSTDDILPKFKTEGGHWMEDLALQNIQARGRMVFSYMLAQLLPTPKIRNTGGYLLVLGSANVDEALRGYFTKYDCSAADLNPIGGICKEDLRTFLRYAGERFSWPSLIETAGAVPTAELRPNEASQNDEEDMGMTYSELTVYGYHRKVLQQGSYSMTRSLIHKWNHLSPKEIAKKVKYFHMQHYKNRHKMTTLTPSYHAEQYSPDDNRFDLRPFLYPMSLEHQHQDMEDMVALIEQQVGEMRTQQSLL